MTMEWVSACTDYICKFVFHLDHIRFEKNTDY